jgi:hypothetical protein
VVQSEAKVAIVSTECVDPGNNDEAQALNLALGEARELSAPGLAVSAELFNIAGRPRLNDLDSAE